jgi:hypothetical protein
VSAESAAQHASLRSRPKSTKDEKISDPEFSHLQWSLASLRHGADVFLLWPGWLSQLEGCGREQVALPMHPFHLQHQHNQGCLL